MQLHAEAEVLEAAVEEEGGDALFPMNSKNVVQPKPVHLCQLISSLDPDPAQVTTLLLQAAQQVIDSGEFLQNKVKKHSIHNRDQ